MGETFDFVQATREGILIKMALMGPPGGGKTWSALALATQLSKDLNLGDVFLIDSENRSSKKYVYNPKTGEGWNFRALYMPRDDYSPQRYMEAIRKAENAGARIIIIDSLSHGWSGPNGILEQVDRLTEKAAKDRGKNYGNSFSDGWKKATPIQNQFVQAILDSPAHIIATMRMDPEWVVPEGKNAPVMVGLSPKQRKDIMFEFDIAMELDRDNAMFVAKTRCHALKVRSGGVFQPPNTERVAAILTDWVKTSDDLPATLDEAIEQAAALAVETGANAVTKTAKEEVWAKARDIVRSFCMARGSDADEKAALERLKKRIGEKLAETKGKSDGQLSNAGSNGAAAHPPTDDDRARAIDQGKA